MGPNFIILMIFSLLLNKEKFSDGIKFSAESLTEISFFAERGKSHLESLREKANVPQFGPCWKNAISDLQIGCKFLSENVQSDLALRFTDCFLQMSGHEPLICDTPKSACLQKLSDRAFNAYTEFYTHTQSICYFLQSQSWHEETEKTINQLVSTSHDVSQKLEKASEIQEELLNQQKQSLSLQHDLNNRSKTVASALQLSQDKINVFMKDFQNTAAEQKQLLVELFENLVLLRSWAVNELSWFNSTVYFVAVTLISFFFTSVSRTREARMTVFMVFAFNYLFERLIASWFLTNEPFLSSFKITPESLNSSIWLCRKFCICLGIFILLYTAFSYYDHNLRNYQLLLEIKNQNLKILQYFAMKTKNEESFYKDNLNEISKSFDHLNNTSKAWEYNSNALLSCNINHERSFNPLSERLFSNSSTVKLSSLFSPADVLDCAEEEPLDKFSIANERKNAFEKLKPSYNLRSLKSRKTIH